MTIQIKYSLLFILAVFLGKAQDTIFKRNADKIICIVMEVGEEIKYKSFTNPDGPTYVIPKSKIKSITYKNGVKEEFKEEFHEVPIVKENSDGTIQGRRNFVDQIKSIHKEKLLSIYTNLTKDLFNEYNFGLEFGINKNLALGISGGILHTNSFFYVFALSPSQARWPGTVYQGGAGKVNLKIYPLGKLNGYWNVQLVYKSMYYRNVEFVDAYAGESNATYTRSEDAYVFGVSVTHGHEYAAANGFMYLDFYYGFGFRQRERKINTLTCKMYPSGIQNPPLGKTTLDQSFPVIEVGLKIGFNFLRKNEETVKQKINNQHL